MDEQERDALIKQSEAQVEKYRALRWIGSFLALALVVSASWLPARELARSGASAQPWTVAGLVTAFILLVTLGPALWYVRWQHKQIAQLKTRNKSYADEIQLLTQAEDAATDVVDVRDSKARKGRK